MLNLYCLLMGMSSLSFRQENLFLNCFVALYFNVSDVKSFSVTYFDAQHCSFLHVEIDTCLRSTGYK